MRLIFLSKLPLLMCISPFNRHGIMFSIRIRCSSSSRCCMLGLGIVFQGGLETLRGLGKVAELRRKLLFLIVIEEMVHLPNCPCKELIEHFTFS